jgi:Undecaprenyl-phosphate galactose phosphotransferase WbaP
MSMGETISEPSKITTDLSAIHSLPLAAGLVAVDLLAVALSFWISFLIRRASSFLGPLQHGLDVYLNAWPALALWPLIFWREGLYPGLWITDREELRRAVAGATLAGVVAMTATFLSKTGAQFSRVIVVGGWLISLGLIPSLRQAFKRALSAAGVSGPRAILIGAGETGRFILDAIRGQHPPAITPMALFDDDVHLVGQEVNGIPVLGTLEDAPKWAKELRIRTAVISMPHVSQSDLLPAIESLSKICQRIVVVPNLFGLSIADTDILELDGVLALSLRRNLLFLHNRIIKRALDMTLTAIISLLFLPYFTLISLLIYLESGRPVFFTHSRVGRNGRAFKAYKFRTMLKNGDEILQQHFDENPGSQVEWERNQKLKQDPRLTVVGRALRRLSLDELPQLWNIIKGDMSLVGPRPIVREEVPRYGSAIDLYFRLRPGLTGLWQVSGRNDLEYAQRVRLDTYYVRNWSIWLDLVILARTLGVVLGGRGAY